MNGLFVWSLQERELRIAQLESELKLEALEVTQLQHKATRCHCFALFLVFDSYLM